MKKKIRLLILIPLLIRMTYQGYAQTNVVGYFPTYQNFPNEISNIDLAKLTHLNIAFANPTSSGTLVVDGASNSAVTTVVNACHAKNVKVLLSIGGGGAPGSYYSAAFSNSTTMTNFVNACVNYATTYNLDGIDVDIEGDVLNGNQVTSTQYQSFVTQLGAALHAKNKIMTAAVADWFGSFVTNTAAAQFDFIGVMAYDEHIPGGGDQPGPNGDYQFAVDNYNYWHAKGVPGSKINIGVPFYGYGWGTYTGASGGDSYASIVAKYPGAENFDMQGSGANAEYYNGIPTIKQKTTFAIQNGSGIMIWDVTMDAIGSKSLLTAINQVVLANSNPVPANLATGKSVTVSSTEVGANVTGNAIDGNYATRWSSLYADPQWITVDLGANYNVNRVKLTWEAAYATTYQIQISTDNTNWSTLKSVTGNTTTTNDQTGLSGTGRYVRIYGTARATVYGYSLYEIEVYGTAVESPYSGTISLPGTIQAENYDLGGEGLAYHDADAANQGGAYRTDGVDIEATTDAGGGYDVGYVAAGEWLKYTVNVTNAGAYNIGFRTAGTANGTISLLVDGANVTGAVSLPNTSGYQTWATTTATNINFTAGQHIVELLMVTGGFNVNYVAVTTAINQPSILSYSLATPNPQQFGKAEINIQVSATFSNAYNASEIVLDMIATSPSGKTIIQPCFYVSGNSPTSNWTARFAPKESGNYSYFFRLTKSGTAVANSATSTFTSSLTSKDGFLHTSGSNWSLRFDSGKPFRGIGQNYGWEPRNYENQKYVYEYMLPRLSSNGANFFRTWMCPWNLPLEWKTPVSTNFYSSSSNYFNPDAINRMDQLVALSETNGMYMMLTLNTFGDLMDQWGINNYNSVNGGPANTPNDFFASANAKIMFKNRLRYLIARWGYSPSIAAFEFFNEIDNAVFGISPNLNQSDVTEWHNEMGQYLKSIDPYGHMVTTSVSYRDITGLDAVPSFDFNQQHIYSDPQSGDYITKIPSTVRSYDGSTGKPYLIGEYGYDWRGPDSDQGAANDDNFKRGLWYGLFSPTPIAPMSWWWEMFDDRNTTAYFKNVQAISTKMFTASGGTGNMFDVTVNGNGLLEKYAAQCGTSYFIYGRNSSGGIINTNFSIPVSASSYNVTLYNTTTGIYSDQGIINVSSSILTLPSVSLNGGADVIIIASTINPVPANLATGKSVTVSSTEVGANVTGNAIDGNYATRWSSLYADPQWITVDLGANYNVNRVKLTWEAAYATTYQIQISTDNTNWSTLKSVTGNTTTTNDQTGLSGTGRYVRIYGTARATVYGYSLYEIEVYGTAVESPYSGTISLPGTIQAENYDLGGEGLAYHDADAANQGGAYRTDGVDIEATTDAGGGYDVGYVAAGEWLKYTVNVTNAGAYNIGFRTAGTANGTISLLVDGANVTGAVSLPNTSGYQTWATTTATNINFTAGQHIVELLMITGGFNVNYIAVTTAVLVAANQPPSVNLTSPNNNASFIAPANIIISANASDNDGSVSKVSFYNGTTLLASDNATPYTYTWTNVAAGSYSITAVATDNSGAISTSASASVTIMAVVTSNPCTGIVKYLENNGYVAGSKVQNAGSEYQCKPYPYSGWCNGAAWAYGPGTGQYWTDAWVLISSCASSARIAEGAPIENAMINAVNNASISNYPNPFTNTTNIEIVVAQAGNINIIIYDKIGKEVETIVNAYLSKGTYNYSFDASHLSADLYFIKFNTADQVFTRKIIKTQ